MPDEPFATAAPPVWLWVLYTLTAIAATAMTVYTGTRSEWWWTALFAAAAVLLWGMILDLRRANRG